MTDRACTCHPSEAPQPCQHRYAYSECRRAALVDWFHSAIYKKLAAILSAEDQSVIIDALDLIRAEVLEEAADTAERHVGTWDEEQAAARRIAAAIRALKGGT